MPKKRRQVVRPSPHVEQDTQGQAWLVLRRTVRDWLRARGNASVAADMILDRLAAGGLVVTTKAKEQPT